MVNILNSFREHIFPLSIAVNMFSITAFMIALSIFGHPELAAEVGIIQAATLVVFMSFSTNARNLILSKNSEISIQKLFTFRVFLLVPLSLISYYLGSLVIETSAILISALILRKCAEWMAELQLSSNEISGNKDYAYWTSIWQITGFLLLIPAILSGSNFVLYPVLYFWAITPILKVGPYIEWIAGLSKGSDTFTVKSIIPHLGSSWIISISIYLFRVLILLLVGKTLSGLLFSAFAIGGLINALYTYAFGPSMAVRNEKKESNRDFSIYLNLLIVISGLVLILYSLTQNMSDQNDFIFLQAIGFSLLGSVIMMYAQRERIHILQVRKDNVFVPDVLSNILIIASVPFAYYLFGRYILVLLFLWNACLAFVVYNLTYFANRTSIRHQSNNRRPIINKYQIIIQTIVIFFLFFPIFFQLDGSIFNSQSMVFDSQGILTRVPLPISVIACFIGVFLLTCHRYVQLSAAFIFSFFVLMVLSTFMVSVTNSENLLAKFIFLIQFILPTFALLLGQSYTTPDNPTLRYETIILIILCFIIPAELIASLVQNREGILTPYLYIFSLYQHLQYLPVIFVALYFLAVFSLFKYKNLRLLLILLLPFIVIYAFASFSRLAMLVLVAGIAVMLFSLIKAQYKRYLYITTSIIVIATVVLLVSLKFNQYFIWRMGQMEISGPIKDLVERFHYYGIYLNGITDNVISFFFGHEQRPDRLTAPSAHNYYLDLVYNFGVISLLPLLWLILYTIRELYYNHRNHVSSTDLIALSVVVLFFVLIDNSLKVGLRQPYPGIIAFFLWGLLLGKLTNIRGIITNGK